MLTVSDLMDTTYYAITPGSPVQEAISLMQEHDVMQLPVVEDDMLVGIITDRDTRLVVNLPILEDMTVGDCMTSDPITVNPGMPAFRAAKVLSTYRFGALPVVEDGRLVGMVTGTQFLQFFARDQQNPPPDEPSLPG